MSATRPDCEADIVDPYCGASPLLAEPATDLLQRVLQKCSGRTVVFDLDSTLLNNRPRSALIMREFAKEFDVPALANARGDHWQDWSAATAMKNIGLNQRQIDAHLDNFEGFWFERFFTSEYCKHDEQIPGAVDYSCRVAAADGSIMYLTGRPQQMRNGTLQCLERLGFPLPTASNSVTLNMKPMVDGSDDDFKQQQSLQLASLPEATAVVAVFDNEPQHINTYNALLPDAECIHLFTDHSMRQIPLEDGISSIRDFLIQKMA